MDQERLQLSKNAELIARVARDAGLDFYPVHFEICPAETLYTFGAYGMPARFAHWSFGKAFYRMKAQYDFNLSKLYEMVINTNPAYAFLLDGNHALQNKLIMSHVYAHVDFFKNNYYFCRTDQNMLDRMAVHAEKIRDYEIRYGRETVEKTLDAVLAIQEHVNPRNHIHASLFSRKPLKPSFTLPSPYDDLWMREEQEEGRIENDAEEDLLLYLAYHSPELEDWQRDILSIIRAESLYFYPQMETKIINEGWATFWHGRIMRSLDLSDGEFVEFSLMHSQVIQPSARSINPYLLGLRIWEKLEKEYAIEDLFEIRKQENDLSFIRNYLDKELIEQLQLFNFRKVGTQWQVTDLEWESVKGELLNSLVHGGHPRITVKERDFAGRGILYLYHHHEGQDLDIRYLEKTLVLMQTLWEKGIYLETVLDGKKVRFECEKGWVKREQL